MCSSDLAGVRRGWLLVIDYALEAWRYYAPQRREGTLMAYRQQRAGADPLAEAGRADLTAHVCLDSLERAAVASGWQWRGSCRQGEALLALGLAARLQELQHQPELPLPELLRRREALLRLVDPVCLGDFRWVALRRSPVGADGDWAAAAGVDTGVAVEAAVALGAEAAADAAEEPPLFLRPPPPLGWRGQAAPEPAAAPVAAPDAAAATAVAASEAAAVAVAEATPAATSTAVTPAAIAAPEAVAEAVEAAEAEVEAAVAVAEATAVGVQEIAEAKAAPEAASALAAVEATPAAATAETEATG